MAVVVLLATLLASCNTTKYLADDEELLVSTKIKLAKRPRLGNQADLSYALSTLGKQQPNGNFLFLFPREYFYLRNDGPQDTTWRDRLLRNTIGEQPAIYSDSLSRRSVADMIDYLRYQGYFDATAYHEADRGKRRRVNLIYHVQPRRRYLIDSVAYTSPDPALDSLLQAARASSELQPGTPLDLTKFDREKARLAGYLRDQGYAFFSGGYFDQLEIDTTRRSGYADVFLSILPARRADAYRRYRVGQVTVLTDFSPLAEGNYRLDTVVDGVRFLSNQPRFRVRPEVLRRSIFLETGAYHKRSDLDKTNLSLSGLGIYRFVRINQQVDSTADYRLNYQLQLTPGKRMSLGTDLDFNYTRRNGGVGANNLLGVSVGPTFQNRNLLRGAELLTTGLRGGVEVNPLAAISTDTFLNTIDLAANATLYLPRFKDVGLYRLLNRLPSPFGGRIISNDFLEQLRERASTRYSVGYEYLSIRDFYAYTLANARLGYDFKRSATTTYRINHLAVDVLDPTILPNFDLILDNSEFLRQSIGEQYFFSLLFRNIEYTRNGRPDLRGRSLAWFGQFEVAGAEVSAVNSLVNALSGTTRTFTPKANATFAKYVVASADVRYLKRFTPKRSFAARFFLGAGRPFGGSRTVPFVKQFFAGGANSMRAWQPRALGPGGFVDTLSLTSENNLRLFQTGDLRLEINAEFRFPLISYFNLQGAAFVDVGNVWTFDDFPDRPGAQFLFRRRPNTDGTFVHQPFYRQLAVGAGTGLRLDLSYFIFRLDVAMPVRYNYPQDGRGDIIARDGSPIPESAYWTDLRGFGFRRLTFQLGLGYPF